MRTAGAYIFELAAGDLLALRREIVEQLPSLIGRSYAEIRSDFNIEAAAGKSGRLMMRAGTAVIPITGPITRTEGFCSSLFGGTSIDGIRAQLREALASEEVSGILLYVDSPGGTVDGVADMADELYSARNSKPLHAYFDGMAASAAYWLGSTATTITASQTSLVGSIGVQMIDTDRTAEQERKGVREIRVISSKSPLKNLPLSTEDGYNRAQALVDGIAEFFLGAVARHRNVPQATVEQEFGQGDVLLAGDALGAKMIDGIGTFDQAVERLRSAVQSSPYRAETENAPASAEGIAELRSLLRDLKRETTRRGISQ